MSFKVMSKRVQSRVRLEAVAVKRTSVPFYWLVVGPGFYKKIQVSLSYTHKNTVPPVLCLLSVICCVEDGAFLTIHQ